MLTEDQVRENTLKEAAAEIVEWSRREAAENSGLFRIEEAGRMIAKVVLDLRERKGGNNVSGT